MSIKHIHLTLIIFSLVLSLGFSFGAGAHEYKILGYVSFIIALGLVFYCVQFIKKMKAI